MPDTNVVAICTSGLLAVVTLTYFLLRSSPQNSPQPQVGDTNSKPRTDSAMQPPNDKLAEPLDIPYTREQLREFDGSNPSKPIYVAIKGTIFDVSKKVDVYGKGKSYNLFAGKDASKALGMSSLKSEDAVSDYSTLPEDEMKVLDDWYSFFKKRYNIVGRVADLPPPSANL